MFFSQKFFYMPQILEEFRINSIKRYSQTQSKIYGHIVRCNKDIHYNCIVRIQILFGLKNDGHANIKT